MDWVPVVSQLKSLVQVCAGDTDGARRTQERFSRQCPVVSQCRSAAEAVFISTEEATKTQLEFARNAADVATATPGLGHVIGVGHYIAGNTEGGDHAMKAASRSTGVALGGAAGFVVGGPAGAAAGGVLGGAAMDGLTTGVDSAVKGGFQPAGTIADIDSVIQKSGGNYNIAGDVFDIVAGTVADGYSPATKKRSSARKGRPTAKSYK